VSRLQVSLSVRWLQYEIVNARACAKHVKCCGIKCLFVAKRSCILVDGDSRFDIVACQDLLKKTLERGLHEFNHEVIRKPTKWHDEFGGAAVKLFKVEILQLAWESICRLTFKLERRATLSFDSLRGPRCQRRQRNTHSCARLEQDSCDGHDMAWSCQILCWQLQ